MSDFMALLISHQNERELTTALERRRLQREAEAAQIPALRTPGRWHNFWTLAMRPGRAVRPGKAVGRLVRPS